MSRKTLIGVLASHDDPNKNEQLASVFDDACRNHRQLLDNFCFVFTGGTYRRLIDGMPALNQDERDVQHKLGSETCRTLHDCGIIRLDETNRGGVTELASLIPLRKVSVLWTFFSPITTHLLFPDNLALLRLADQWHVKKLMNRGSVEEWLKIESKLDANLNRQQLPLEIKYPGGVSATLSKVNLNDPGTPTLKWRDTFPEPSILKAVDVSDFSSKLSRTVIALISHDAMKNRMLDFVIDYENELSKFKAIFATGTTGKLIQEASHLLAEKQTVKPHHSGPKGGDIEIAAEILSKSCHVVIFFVDPLHSHPHMDDIRVVFGACMIENAVRMLSNEAQARDWMDRVVRQQDWIGEV